MSDPCRAPFVSENPPHLCHFGIFLPGAPNGGHWPQRYLEAWRLEALRLEGSADPQGLKRRMLFFDESTHSGLANGELIDKVESEQLAGLIFAENPYAFSGTSVLKHPGLPRVAVCSKPIDGTSTISLDNRTLLDKGLQYLAERGRRRLAIITISSYRYAMGTEELIARVLDRGLTTHRHWVHGIDMRWPQWAAHCAEMLARCGGPDGPDSLFVIDDNLLHSATCGLTAAGVRVPDDIEVVAHCNFPYPTPSTVPVKRVGFNIRYVARLAVGMIERGRRGEEMPPVTTVSAVADDELESCS